MKPFRFTTLHGLLFGITVILSLLILSWERNSSRKDTAHADSATSHSSLSQALPDSPEPSTTPPAKAGRDLMLTELNSFWRRLNQNLSPEQTQPLIEEMTLMLWTGDPTQVGAAIRAFLDTGRDATTGLPFRVGEGCLAFSPTMRVALLDLLERLDFGEAAEYAEMLVARMESPDEVALALRTLMHVPGGDARRQLAINGVDRLLQRADWKARPSGGYLEAFDIATQADDPVIWKRLLSLTADAEAYIGTQQGAGLAVHTLAVRSPEFRQLIAKRDSSVTISSIIRGQLMARLDPRVPEELEALNTFVTDPAMTPEEAQAFAANFPSQRDLAGFRLVSDTESLVRPLRDAAHLDIAASQALTSWQSMKVSAPLHPHMQSLLSRLHQNAASAQKAL